MDRVMTKVIVVFDTLAADPYDTIKGVFANADLARAYIREECHYENWEWDEWMLYERDIGV